MPRYTYVALDARGQESTGLVEARSSNEAIGQLRQAGYFPTSVYEEGKGGPDKKVSRAGAKAARVARPRTKISIVLFQRKKVKPKIIMMTMAIAIMAFLLVFIVPKFEAIFHDMLGDKPLPAITLFVIGVSNFVKNHGLVLLGLLIAAVAAYKLIARTRAGRSIIDRFKLRVPLFGDLIRKTAISRFSRTLGTLVTSGVPILQALNITRETAGNMVIAGAISQVHDSVKEGESIVQPLEASGAFPPMAISMIDVGEETGQLPEMLLKIADVYDDETDNSVAALTSMLEPIMIVFLALVVGTIVIALFLPLISIIQGLQQQT